MMQYNVADTSKTEYYKQRINIRLLMQCEGMIYSEQKVVLHLYCNRQEPLRLNCQVSLQTRSGIAHTPVQACGGAIFDICCNQNKYEKCIL